MTDSDIRTLKTYLRDCLEPRLKYAEEMVAVYTGDPIKIAMRNYFSAQVAAYEYAIDDFKELFEEELAEECDHQWIASYTAEEKIDGYDCPKCGEHKGIGEELKEGE